MGFARLLLVVDQQGQVTFRRDLSYHGYSGEAPDADGNRIWALPLVDRRHEEEDLRILAAEWIEQQYAEFAPAPDPKKDGIEFVFDDAPVEENFANLLQLLAEVFQQFEITPALACLRHPDRKTHKAILLPVPDEAMGTVLPEWLMAVFFDEDLGLSRKSFDAAFLAPYTLFPICEECEQQFQAAIEKLQAIGEAARLTGWQGDTLPPKE